MGDIDLLRDRQASFRFGPHLALAFGALLVLSSCNRVDNIQSVKSQDYTSTPRDIFGYIPLSAFSSDKGIEDFKKNMVNGMAECGVRLQFWPGVLASSEHYQPALMTPVTPPAGFAAALVFRELGHETTTLRGGAVGYDNFVDMYRLEITLTDLASKKTVWKSQGDYRTADNGKLHSVFHSLDSSAGAAWSGTVLTSMRNEGLLGACRSADAIAPGPVTIAAASPAAPPMAVASSAAASASSVAPTGAAAPAKAPSYKINNVTYASLDEAEAALRANAVKEVAQVAAVPGPPRDTLLIVAIGDKQAKIASTPGQTAAQLEPVLAFMHVVNKVGYDSAAEAVRHSNLFKQVILVNGEDVADADFKGAAYKLWFSSGSWGLAKPAGARQKTVAPMNGEPKAANLNSFVNSLQQAATAADQG